MGVKKYRFLRNILLIGIILIPIKSVFAYDDEFWEKIAKRSDVKIVTEGQGKIAYFTSGVRIGDDGLGLDHSGNGAVLCAWEIYVAVKNMVDICPSKEHEKPRENLNYAIERINNFIIENSLTPVTKEEIEKAIEKKLNILKEQVSKISKDDTYKQCTIGDLIKMARQLNAHSDEEFKKSIDDLLSVPRPPVLNPCL